MSKTTWLCLVILGLTLLVGARTEAAPPKPAPSGGTASTAAALTIERIQAKLDALSAMRDLPESERTEAKDLYQQAISQLQAVKNYTDSAALFQQLQQSAPTDTARLQQSLTSEEPPPPAPTLSTEDLSQQLVQTQAKLSDAQKRLSDLDQQLTVQQARPKAIPAELSTLKQQVADLDSKLQSPAPAKLSPLLTDARLLALTTQRQALNQQVAMLEGEQLSYDARLALLNAQRAGATQDVLTAQARVQQLQNLINTHRRDEATAVVQQTDQAKQDAAAQPKVVQTAAAANADISRQLADLVQRSDEVSISQEQLNRNLAQLTERMRGIRQQLGIAGFSDAVGPILLKERRKLPDIRQYQRNADQRQQSIIEARLEQYQAEEYLRRTRAIEDNVEQIATDLDPQLPQAQRAAVTEELRSLMADRQQLLEKLGGGYANLITQLVALDDTQRKLSEQAEQYGTLIDKYLLWIRSSPPVDGEWLKSLRVGVDWLVDPARWRMVGQNLVSGASYQPTSALAGLLVFLGLLLYRRPLIRRLGERVDAIGDVRRDRFWLTLRAIGVTVLLALPWPWLVAWLGWLLSGARDDTGFARGLAQGLFTGAFSAVIMTFIRQLCRPRGVAIAHFGWNEAGCQLLRRHLNWFLWVGPPSMMIVRLCEVQTDTFYSDTLGRVAFCFGSLGLALLVWMVFSPRKSLLAALASGRPSSLWRLRYLWYPLMGGLPLIGSGLALAGYYYTALQIRERLMLMILLLGGAVLLINLFLRWLNVSQRRLAWRHARAKREAQIAARASKDAVPGPGDIAPELQHLPDLDLNTISEQTRSLIRFTVLIGMWFGLWQVWGGLFPAFTILNEITLWHQTVQTAAGVQVADITLGSLAGAVLLLLLVGFLAHNLPGVLELVVLQRLAMEPGNRNAIITISRYLIVGVGLVTALDMLGLNWSQVQWLVAALGVGLGFGLQEIFGNFISGLILLLERPIRVGDTVTLNTLSGKVAHINIRATTIIDWDRKALIVPNKTFITASLINWTRNDPITRIVIPVGVSYNSDPLLVHQVLLEVATAHPLVIKDPPPAALFLRFGDSALEFEVWVFVRELANRVPVTHDLHNHILQALRQHGIEIPFPQQDVHVRDMPTGLRGNTLAGGANGGAANAPAVVLKQSKTTTVVDEDGGINSFS